MSFNLNKLFAKVKGPAKRKCKTEGCTRLVEPPYLYCSIECACYDGAYSVKTGWLRDPSKDEK